MNYQRNFVLCAFRSVHSDTLEPSAQRLKSFDDALAAEFDSELRKQAAKNGITINDFNLSILMFFATQSMQTSADAQVDEACTYFLATTPTP